MLVAVSTRCCIDSLLSNLMLALIVVRFGLARQTQS
jgi:hypothetical protein